MSREKKTLEDHDGAFALGGEMERMMMMMMIRLFYYFWGFLICFSLSIHLSSPWAYSKNALNSFIGHTHTKQTERENSYINSKRLERKEAAHSLFSKM